MISLIAAYAENRVIGYQGQIPWNILGEQSQFRELTLGKTVLMGRRTYEEIGHSLPGRETIVLSRTRKENTFDCPSASSMEEALRMASYRDIFIAGGAELYARFLPLADRLYLTEIHARPEGDTFFPHFDCSLFFRQEGPTVPGLISYTRVTYIRKQAPQL